MIFATAPKCPPNPPNPPKPSIAAQPALAMSLLNQCLGGLGMSGAFVAEANRICPTPAPPAQKSVFGGTAMNCRRPEQQFRSALLEHDAVTAVPNTYSFNVGNRGRGSPIEAGVFKSRGVRPSVPGLIHQEQTYGLELEVDCGRITPVPATTHALMRATGGELEVAIGIDDALEQVQRWQLLRGRTQ